MTYQIDYYLKEINLDFMHLSALKHKQPNV